MSASNQALADLLTNLPAADTSGSPTLGPWFAATYRGACSGCGSQFEEFDRIRADGEGGWLADCCGNVDDGTTRQPAQQDIANLIANLPAPSVSTEPAYPAHVMEAGGPDHYAAGQGQALHNAILAADWGTVRQIAADPYTAGDDVDTARGALAAVFPPGPPPSTVELMRGVLDDLDRDRPRSRQTALGPSELGTPCQRQIAYKLGGVERRPEDKRPPWAPMQGTAVHGLMEEALQFHNQQLGRERWLIEERLEIDPGLPGVPGVYGHGDAYDTDTDTVVDWKHTGVTTLREVSRKTIPNEQLVKPDYRIQAHLYGLGHQRAGRDVRWVRLVFLARSHDYSDSREWTEAYDADLAHWAVLRYYGTHDLLAALNPAATPALWAAVPAVPGKACDWCPFRRPGGPADQTGCPGNTEQKINKQLHGLLA